jgi:3'-5' exoribonuclease
VRAAAIPRYDGVPQACPAGFGEGGFGMSTVATENNKRYIKDMGPSEFIRGLFAIANAQLGRTRSDKPYLRCLLSDRTGEVSARMWSIEETVFRRLPTDGFVWVEGETQPYQGELQLIIHAIDAAEPSPDQMRDLIPCSARDPEEMWAEFTAILGTISHPAMRALVSTILADDYLVSAFKRCPAAKSMHHAYLGGLLEHTLQLVKIADATLPLYPRLNRDLVILGLFLHDIGKTRELVFDRAFAYTDRGELVGHIVEGVVMLREKAQQAMRDSGIRFPTGSIMVLEHIIASHHGLPEFGAAKVPATPEAIFVSLLDNLDAKTAMALAAARSERNNNDLGGNFTEKQWALGAKLYRPDPLA